MIEPLILGRGLAGEALRQALALYPGDVAPPRWLRRDAPLPAPHDPARSLLVLANPDALHTPRLLEAAERGYRYAICEKPAAVSLEQLERLEGLPVATWICHGYRLLWGPQELRRQWVAGRFGTVISLEGRYWQSSAAQGRAGKAWKDDPRLAGASDVLLDLGTHWVDLVVFLLGRPPDATVVRRWYVNAASAHRDTHLHVTQSFGETVAFGSVSKTVHGEGNTLELEILGEKASARWAFSDPDVIGWGEGRHRRLQARETTELPARLPPFHGLGWLEGYGRLVGDVVAAMRRGRPARAATLDEHRRVLRCLLTSAG